MSSNFSSSAAPSEPAAPSGPAESSEPVAPSEPASGSKSDRRLDIVLFGATGFTGGLVADYLSEHLPEGATWALAGRSHEKLKAVAARLASEYPNAPAPELLEASVSEQAQLAELARAARVVISTVGPYLELGEPLVAACAEAGTDYVDLCGEPEFVDEMYLRHHETARASGARLVHACGFDSIPHDLGAYFTVSQLPEEVSIALYGAVLADARFSGGTLHSAVGQMSRLERAASAARRRRAAEGPPLGRRVRSCTRRPHRDKVLDRWLVPLPTIDPQIVLRSAAALPQYGPDFSYGHYASVGSPIVAAGGVGAVAAIAAGSRIPPIRERLLRSTARGRGPSAERRAKSSFSVTFVAHAGGRTVVTRVAGGDPGYAETAMMISQSALCLAFDGISVPGGQHTPAAAMGEPLLTRLQDGGLVFEVLRD